MRNALRMRPDRIIVGEVRGAEALDMLQAMNTGHDGSLSTVHANSPRDALSRIETMVLMAGYDLPMRAIRQQVATALDLVVHLERLEDGTRRVTRSPRCSGWRGTWSRCRTSSGSRSTGISPDRRVEGGLRPTGLRPSFLTKFQKHGVELPLDMFQLPGNGHMTPPRAIARTAR